MSPNDEDSRDLRESLIRLEAKIDVILSRHESKIEDLTRRQAEINQTLREQDVRITANALTVAETRAQTAAVQADVNTLQAQFEKRGNNSAAWVAVAVAALAVVVSPILSALMH